jgi:hypothetical protein
MERIKVTEAQVKTALIEAVAEKGDDYVYTNPDGESATGAAASCYYVHGDKPGCLVGNALHRLGVPLSALEAHEMRGAYSVAKELIDVTDSSSTFTMLAEVQDSQDNGAMWGDALAYAGVVTRVGDDA